MNITDEQKSNIIRRLEGTSGIDELVICEEHVIDLNELEEIMIDGGYERCGECGWWCETGELVDSNCNVKPCDSCQSLKEDE